MISLKNYLIKLKFNELKEKNYEKVKIRLLYFIVK